MSIFEAKVKTLGKDKKGNNKIISLSYIVLNDTYAEVEEQLMTFAVSIPSISLSKYEGIINEASDDKSELYKSCVALNELAEDGSMKETKIYVLVWAHSTEEANEELKGWISENMSILSVGRSNFIDVL